MEIGAGATLRIARDIRDVQTGSDLSLAVAVKDSNIRVLRALIVGPPGTPYEFGFFEFSFIFPRDYPHVCPKVTAVTTNSGYTRFNPNIYSDGHVCLSILGTWRGEQGEGWSTAQGLESVLVSIQSLLSSNPYVNEPGFERCDSDRHKKEADEYRSKIHHETLRISVINRLEEYLGLQEAVEEQSEKEVGFGDDEEEEEEPWEPFIERCKHRFLWYYDAYRQSIADTQKEHGTLIQDGTRFHMTSFEQPQNGMQGTYNYSDLEIRLATIHEALERETLYWVSLGRQNLERETAGSLLFQNHFESIKRRFQDSGNLELSLPDKRNPFVWQLNVFGRPMSNLEGGVFRIKIVFHQDFPSIWPRVVCETPLFHHRVSSKGTVCYVPSNGQEVSSHLEAIVEAIEQEEPTHDPRTLVNPEAAKLLWGTAEEKKMYNRKLRRSAQDSVEF